MSIKKKKFTTMIFGTLFLSMIAMISVPGDFSSKFFQESNTHNNIYQEYLDAQKAYEDKLNDLSVSEENLANVLEELLQIESNLQSIQENSKCLGTIEVLSQYNRNFNTSFCILKSEISYCDFLFYRLTLEHPKYSSNSLVKAARIFAGYCRPSSVQSIAEYIESNVDYPSNDECILNGLLTYCQDRGEFEPSIHFIEDGVNVNDNAKYPVETLCEGGGDCEDKSILFASLARALDYDVRICCIPRHVFVAVRLDSSPTNGDVWHITINDENYYTCETTYNEWLIGNLPTKYQNETIYSYPVL